MDGHASGGAYVSAPALEHHLPSGSIFKAPICIKEDENSAVGWIVVEEIACKQKWVERIYLKLCEKVRAREEDLP